MLITRQKPGQKDDFGMDIAGQGETASFGMTQASVEMIDAADKIADLWDDGLDIPANEVRAAITNAFYAGVVFQRATT